MDGDGCSDLLMARTSGPFVKQSPVAYRNNGRGQFRPLGPERFWRRPRDVYFGYGSWPADVNGDGRIDFVAPLWDLGPDNMRNTHDDFTRLVTVLNMTLPQPTRCG